MSLAPPIYKRGSSFYLLTHINSKQVKRSLRTSYQRVATMHAIDLINGMTMHSTRGLARRYAQRLR